MTASEFIAAGGEIQVTLKSPTGESKTTTLQPVQHKRGSCGWKHKAEEEWTTAAGDKVDVSIAMTVVIQKSGQWQPGKRRWSQAVADLYTKQYGAVPDCVTVE